MAEMKCRYGSFLVIIFVTGIVMSTVKYSQGDKELRMVNLLYRHGDRSPVKTFPLDSNVKLWPQGLGQLTQVGMQQEYRLGQFIKARYITKRNLLNISYIREQVYCRSTDYDRTIMSAQAQLNGLYPPYGRQVWREGVKWQPIPVHVESHERDEILAASNCPKLEELRRTSHSHPKYLSMVEKYKGLVERLDPLLGFNGSLDFYRLWSVHDNFHCSLSHNFSIPSWVNTTILNELKNLSDFQMGWMFYSKELSSLSFGPLLGEMIQHMTDNIHKPKDTKKMYLYSAHDTTITGLLSLLELFDGFAPPYSSAVMLELYSPDKPGDDYTVSIFYRIGQSSEPKQLTLKGCSTECPLNKFIELTNSLIPKDREKACGNKKGVYVKPIIYKSFLAAFAGTLAILIVLVVCACCCWCRYRRSVSRAARVDFDDGALKDASLLDNQDYDSD